MITATITISLPLFTATITPSLSLFTVSITVSHTVVVVTNHHNHTVVVVVINHHSHTVVVVADLQLAAQLGKSLLDRNRQLEAELRLSQQTQVDQAKEIQVRGRYWLIPVSSHTAQRPPVVELWSRCMAARVVPVESGYKARGRWDLIIMLSLHTSILHIIVTWKNWSISVSYDLYILERSIHKAKVFVIIKIKLGLRLWYLYVLFIYYMFRDIFYLYILLDLFTLFIDLCTFYIY